MSGTGTSDWFLVTGNSPAAHRGPRGKGWGPEHEAAPAIRGPTKPFRPSADGRVRSKLFIKNTLPAKMFFSLLETRCSRPIFLLEGRAPHLLGCHIDKRSGGHWRVSAAIHRAAWTQRAPGPRIAGFIPPGSPP